MPLTINTNVSAMVAQRNLAASNARSTDSLSKLSSGSRVPNAKADAAALAIGTGLRADVASLNQAKLNAQQGVSVLQIADGAFQNISDILMRMKSLASQAMSDQVSNSERTFLNNEYTELVSEIDRIAGSTEFNGTKLLGGVDTIILDTTNITSTDTTTGGNDVNASAGFVGFKFDNSKVTNGDDFNITYDTTSNMMTVTNTVDNVSQSLKVAAAPTDGSLATYNFDDVGVSLTLNSDFDPASAIADTDANTITAMTGTAGAQAALEFQVGIGTTDNADGAGNVDTVYVQIGRGSASALGVGGTAVSDRANAQAASTAIDTAISNVNTARADLGAQMNRLEFAGNNISVAIENVESARSSLLDVDVAAEITKFTSEQVLVQAGVSMLAQANQQPSQLLRLLQ